MASLVLTSVLTPAAESPSLTRDIRPLLDSFCYPCHNADKKKGDLDLVSISRDEDAANKATRAWRHALPLLHHGDMPPENAKKQPTQAERERLIAWIERLKRPEGPPDPGRVTTRRLNRTEYDHTIRDLTGLDLNLAKDFPSDDVGNGFDNIGDVLNLSPLLLEKYLDAAGTIVAQAIVEERVEVAYDAAHLPGAHAGKTLAADAKGGPRVFTAHGEVVLVQPVGDKGRFTLKVTAGADQAGSEPVRMVVKLGNTVVKDQPVRAKRASPATISVALTLEPGPNRILVQFVNPHTEPAPPKNAPPPKGAGLPGTRALEITRVELLGPPVKPPPASHQRIMIARPSATVSRAQAARTILESFATRAFRRPVDPGKLDRLMQVFALADGRGETFTGAMRVALQAVLVSPQFLFRLEPDRPSKAPLGVYTLDAWEIASRLSYFLWSSMPDDDLFALARSGKLVEPTVIDQQVRRMLKDPKAKALVSTFAEQWLQMRNLSLVTPDRAHFPEFDQPLRQAMYDEVAAYFEAVVREDRSVLEFLDSDWTYLNERLAKHYGISGVTGPQLRKVTLSERSRGGVLGMANFLTITSNPARTSPVKRGKWILEEILGTPPPPAPPDVTELPERGAPGTSGLSLRQLLEKHRADPACASCHARMDPLGFGFENFDAIGRWRTSDEGAPIDASGVLPGGLAFRGPGELKTALLQHKDEFAANLTRKLLTFALGRGLTEEDDGEVERLTATLIAGQYRFSVLATAVATSYPFRHRRPAH